MEMLKTDYDSLLSSITASRLSVCLSASRLAWMRAFRYFEANHHHTCTSMSRQLAWHLNILFDKWNFFFHCATLVVCPSFRARLRSRARVWVRVCLCFVYNFSLTIRFPESHIRRRIRTESVFFFFRFATVHFIWRRHTVVVPYVWAIKRHRTVNYDIKFTD